MPDYNINDLNWETEFTEYGYYIKTALLEEWHDAKEDSPVACISHNTRTGENEFSVENFSEEPDSVTSGDTESEAILDEMFGAEQWRAATEDLEAEYHKAVQEALRLVKSAGYTIN